MIVYFWGNHICSICSEVTDKALHQPALPAMMEGSHHIDVKMVMMLMMMVVMERIMKMRVKIMGLKMRMYMMVGKVRMRLRTTSGMMMKMTCPPW